jgi:hypothetical protein
MGTSPLDEDIASIFKVEVSKVVKVAGYVELVERK